MTDQPTSSSTTTTYKFDAKRWTHIDRTVLIATLVFFISLFLPWYGYKVFGGDYEVDGLWHGYMYIPLIVAIATIAYLVLLALTEHLPFKMPLEHTRALMIATAIDLLFTIIGFLDKPGFGSGWRWGAFVGLIAAVIAFFPFGKPMVDAFRARKSTTTSSSS